jgi:alpha-glucosidase
VFAGDEVGVAGANCDAARQPFPWDESIWDHELLSTYRDLIALRRSSDALRRGSLRFVAAGRHAVAYVRETAGERILVHASRAPHESLHGSASDIGVTAVPELLYGEGVLTLADDAVSLAGAGPALSVWRIG